MSRVMLGLSVALLFVAPAAASEPELNGDLAKLQGRWTTRAGPGKAMPLRLDVRGRKVSVRISLPGKKVITAEGELRVDETVTPKAIDWVNFTTGDGQELPDMQAIYEFDGKSLRLRNGGPGNERPTDFEPGEGYLADVVVFKPADRAAGKDEPK